MVHLPGFSAVTLCTTDLKATVSYHCKDPHSSRMYHFYRLYSTSIVMFYLLISSLMPESDAFEYRVMLINKGKRSVIKCDFFIFFLVCFGFKCVATPPTQCLSRLDLVSAATLFT